MSLFALESGCTCLISSDATTLFLGNVDEESRLQGKGVFITGVDQEIAGKLQAHYGFKLSPKSEETEDSDDDSDGEDDGEVGVSYTLATWKDGMIVGEGFFCNPASIVKGHWKDGDLTGNAMELSMMHPEELKVYGRKIVDLIAGIHIRNEYPEFASWWEERQKQPFSQIDQNEIDIEGLEFDDSTLTLTVLGLPLSLKSLKSGDDLPSQPPRFEEEFVGFLGTLQDGERSGRGWMFYADGSKLYGNWVQSVLTSLTDLSENEEEKEMKEEKEVDESEDETADPSIGICRYFYPDGSEISGIWEDGDLAGGVYEANEEVEYSREPWEEITVEDSLGVDLLKPDPYEAKIVHVGPSLMEGAGEGLFASVNLRANTIVSFYNGIRLTQEEVDAREWEQNSNCISVDEFSVVDVPEAWIDTKVYRATLGHKANHSLEPNAQYAPYFDHPRFGRISCIRTIKPVRALEEICVDYKYDEGDGPEWYKKLLSSVSSSDQSTPPPAKIAKTS